MPRKQPAVTKAQINQLLIKHFISRAGNDSPIIDREIDSLISKLKSILKP